MTRNEKKSIRHYHCSWYWKIVNRDERKTGNKRVERVKVRMRALMSVQMLVSVQLKETRANEKLEIQLNQIRNNCYILQNIQIENYFKNSNCSISLKNLILVIIQIISFFLIQPSPLPAIKSQWIIWCLRWMACVVQVLQLGIRPALECGDFPLNRTAVPFSKRYELKELLGWGWDSMSTSPLSLLKFSFECVQFLHMLSYSLWVHI